MRIRRCQNLRAEDAVIGIEELRKVVGRVMVVSLTRRWLVVGLIAALVVIIAAAFLVMLRTAALEAQLVELTGEVESLSRTARDLRRSVGLVLEYGGVGEPLGDWLALELANTAYDSLIAGDVDFVFRWAETRYVEIYVEFDDRVSSREINIADPARDSEMTEITGLESSQVLDELLTWVSECGAERPSDHHFIPDRHSGGYRNVVLHVPAGYLWLQFDDVMILSKIRATRTQPHPE